MRDAWVRRWQGKTRWTQPLAQMLAGGPLRARRRAATAVRHRRAAPARATASTPGALSATWAFQPDSAHASRVAAGMASVAAAAARGRAVAARAGPQANAAPGDPREVR
ncbi:hypothetical protein G6F57_018063 [Rhizopus arrhizus]|nr:hypothetical protein G6F57_018063 [Rhizopus arrhizus]